MLVNSHTRSAAEMIAAFVKDNYCEVAVVDGMRLLTPCDS